MRSRSARLRLQDIDWRAGELSVRGKGGRVDRMPLTSDVGAALADWLRHGRRASAFREVFLRTTGPDAPMKRQSIVMVPRCASVRAGIPVVGAHRLRHRVACRVLAGGGSLAEVAELLRHNDHASSAIYAKSRPVRAGGGGAALASRGAAMTALHEAVDRYLAIRRGLGYKLTTEGRILGQFVVFCDAHELDHVTMAAALEWATTPAGAEVSWWAARLTVVRELARFQAAFDERTEVPPTNLLPRSADRPQPYLDSSEQIAAMLQAAQCFANPLAPPPPRRSSA